MFRLAAERFIFIVFGLVLIGFFKKYEKRNVKTEKNK